MSEDIVAMARAAQRDERLSDGPLYGKLADEITRLRAENIYLRRAGMDRPSAELHEAALAELREEITRLSEQLHLANIDAVGAHAEANELREQLRRSVALTIRHIDTQQCSVSDLRTLIAARSALEAKP